MERAELPPPHRRGIMARSPFAVFYTDEEREVRPSFTFVWEAAQQRLFGALRALRENRPRFAAPADEPEPPIVIRVVNFARRQHQPRPVDPANGQPAHQAQPVPLHRPRPIYQPRPFLQAGPVHQARQPIGLEDGPNLFNFNMFDDREDERRRREEETQRTEAFFRGYFQRQ